MEHPPHTDQLIALLSILVGGTPLRTYEVVVHEEGQHEAYQDSQPALPMQVLDHLCRVSCRVVSCQRVRRRVSCVRVVCVLFDTEERALGTLMLVSPTSWR